MIIIADQRQSVVSDGDFIVQSGLSTLAADVQAPVYSGDAVAGDFIFSLRIFITAANDAGNYRFEFQARDYSELSGEKVTHIITVIK